MNYSQAQEALRRIRYWAANNNFETASSDDESYVNKQNDNLIAAITEWESAFFKNFHEDIRYVFIDAYDHAKGVWRNVRLLASKEQKLQNNLAKYLYVLQAYPKTIIGVRSFFFDRLSWQHGIITFELGDNLEVNVKSLDSKDIDMQEFFKETKIVLPRIKNTCFYESFLNFDGLKPINIDDDNSFQYLSPSVDKQSDGQLEDAERKLSEIWGGDENISLLDSVLEKIDEICTTKKPQGQNNKELGRWVLTNISWILETMSENSVKAQNHYYFYRALSENRDDPFFNSFGDGLLIWSSNIPTVDKENDHKRFTQSIALTSCLMYSRLTETSLPHLQKRLILQKSQTAILQRGNLTWLLDHVVLPNLLGVSLKNDESGNFQYDVLDSSSATTPVLDPPSELKELINILAPSEMRHRHLTLEQQREILIEVIIPLRADGISSADRLFISELEHGLNLFRLSNGKTRSNIDGYQNGLEDYKMKCVAQGPLFIPVHRAVSDVEQKLAELSQKFQTTKDEDAQYEDIIDRAITVINHLDTRKILTHLHEQWGDDGVQRDVPCGKGTEIMSNCPDPTKRPLPFYISDLDFVYKALRHNWKKHQDHTTCKSYFIWCETIDWFILLWREEKSWCNDFTEWKKKAWDSLTNQSKWSPSSRGLPLVIRFASQNSADLFWIRTNGLVRNFILGDQQKFDDFLSSQTCVDCKTKLSDDGKFYEIGIGFSPDNWKT